MSFFSNFKSDKCPGAICGNPLNGLNEKACIQAQKIFDAGIQQLQQTGLILPITNPVPATYTPPLTFVSAKNTSSQGTVTALQVDKLDKSNSARVQATVQIPLQLVYVDANGVEGTADSTISLTEDVILGVPCASLIPYEVDAVVSFISPEGTYNTDGSFTVNACTTVIMRVSTPVELLVPTYGYCAIPPAQEYTQEVCSGLFELPLYPSTDSGCCRRDNQT